MTEMEPSRTLLVLLMELQRLFPATGHGGWICVLELQVFDNTGVGGVRLRKWKDNKSSIPSHQVGARIRLCFP